MRPPVRILDALAVCALALAVVPWGRVEGALFPVATEAVFEVVPAGPGRASVTAQLTKHRACRFVAIEWRIVGPERSGVLDVTEARNTQARVGRQTIGPWLVSAEADTLRRHGQAVVFHRCGWPWLTRTALSP